MNMHRVILALLATTMALCGTAFAQENAIQPGDVVYVSVFRHDDLSASMTVDGNGMIAMPYVGNINIGGATPEAAARMVEDGLSAILKSPRVTISRGPAPAAAATLGGAPRTREMRTEVVQVTNARAESIYAALSGMATQGGSISFDEDTNSVIITDEPGTLANMLDVVAQLDGLESQITQVHIETKIAEVESTAIKEVGLRWFVQGDHAGGGYTPNARQDARVNSARTFSDPLFNERLDTNTGNGRNTGVSRRFIDEARFDRRMQIPIQTASPGQMFLGYLNQGIDLGVMLDALVADNKADLLASPYIRTVNHKKASILMTEQFPYSEIGSAGLSTVTRTEFLDVGITLDVTPHVRADPDGVTYVQLELEPEVSTATGMANGVPIRSVRSSTSIANVRDGQTLVIGGIVQSDSRDVIQKVPGLGDVPVVGMLFRHKEKSATARELMIFVTPRVYARPEAASWGRVETLAEAMSTDLISSLESRADQKKE
jgi:type II secretory pathway component GspD/PulD (secretin)